MFKRQQCILFQGDSITDAGRDKSSRAHNDAAGMGRGYAFLAMSRVLADRPELDLRFYNRGVSGNRVPDLRARWNEDCLELQPDVLSILIGVNDIWHKMEGRYSGSVAEYERGYRELLEETRDALPRALVIICEPFALQCGAVGARWFPEFDERRAVAARVAADADAVFVPFQSIVDRAVAAGAPAQYWAGDGVHPTPQGHQLLADAWIAAVSRTARQ